MTKTLATDAELEQRAMDLDPDGRAVRDRSATADIRAAVRERSDAEEHVRRAVDAARDAGITWVEIGAALGVSHQAAMQRYKR